MNWFKPVKLKVQIELVSIISGDFVRSRAMRSVSKWFGKGGESEGTYQNTPVAQKEFLCLVN